MDHCTEETERQNHFNSYCDEMVRAGVIGSGDRSRLADVLFSLPAASLFDSISAACVRRFFQTARSTAGNAPVDEPVRFGLFEEFLAPEELSELTKYVLSHERQFRTSQVISHSGNGSKTDYDHRRSRVFFNAGPFQDLIVDRLRSCLGSIFRSLQHREFPVSTVEVQITASNDGEYFRIHNDNTHSALVTREITYVLFFHREPKAFSGGELRLYDSRFENGRYVAGRAYTSILPQQNMVVFFPSYFMHEVETVHCPSHAFADSRLTVNGWLHR